MKCPVCGKEAKIQVYYCAQCLVYVHAACWQKHIMDAHKGEKTEKEQNNIESEEKPISHPDVTIREVAIAKREVGLTKRQVAVTNVESPEDRKTESNENK